MTYTKPELVALTHAVETIQSGTKDSPPFLEGDRIVTSPAYEADE